MSPISIVSYCYLSPQESCTARNTKKKRVWGGRPLKLQRLELLAANFLSLQRTLSTFFLSTTLSMPMRGEKCFSPGISCKVYLKIEIFWIAVGISLVPFRWGPSDYKVTFCDANLVETQRETTIGHFLEHRLKKLGPGAKPQRSFMMVRQRKIAKDIHFFQLFSLTSLSRCYYHEQYHSLPTAGNFCEQNTIENLYFQIHSLLARNNPGWTFRVPSRANEWPLADLIHLSLFIHIWFILHAYFSHAFVFQHL